MRVLVVISMFTSIAIARAGAADLYKCETIQTYEATNIKKTCMGHQVSFACFALDKATDWHCFNDAEMAKSVDCTQVNTPDGHKYDGGCVYNRDYTFWGKLDGTNLATKAAHDLVKQFKDITGGFPSLLQEKALLGGPPVPPAGAANLYKCETIATYKAKNIKRSCMGHQVSFACFSLDKVTDWHCFNDEKLARTVDCTKVNTPDGHKYDGGCVYMRDYTFWGKLDGTNLATKAAHDLVKQFKDITGGFPSLLQEKALLGGPPVPPAGAANLYKCETIATYKATNIKRSCMGHRVSFACFSLDKVTDWHCFNEEKLARTVDCTKVNTPDGHKYDGGCVYMRDYTFWGKLDGTNLATKAAHDLAKQFKDITGGFR